MISVPGIKLIPLSRNLSRKYRLSDGPEDMGPSFILAHKLCVLGQFHLLQPTNCTDSGQALDLPQGSQTDLAQPSESSQSSRQTQTLTQLTVVSVNKVFTSITECQGANRESHRASGKLVYSLVKRMYQCVPKCRS